MARSTAISDRPDRLAKIAVAAEQNGVCGRTIRNYIARGRLTGYRMGERLLYVDLDEVDALFTPVATTSGDGGRVA